MLADHLRKRGLTSLAAAGLAAGQPPFDEARFRESLTKNLADGRFRLVLVLDAIPPELPRLVSYLEGIAENLLIDLIAVSGYEVGGEQVLVPQRVEPERRPVEIAAKSAAASSTIDEPGANAFERVLEGAADLPGRAAAQRLVAWARGLEQRHLATLMSVQGQQMATLRIYIPGDMSLACLYRDKTGVHLEVFRSVFTRRAPLAPNALDRAMSPKMIGQGTNVEPSDQILEVIARGTRRQHSHWVHLGLRSPRFDRIGPNWCSPA